MKNPKGLLLAFICVVWLGGSGCIAVPPLITVHQKESSTSDATLKSRLEELERRVQRLEERK